MENAFSYYHPSVNFMYFIAVVFFGMFFLHPVFLFISLICSISYYIILKGKKGVKFLFMILMIVLFLSVMNALLIQLGETVLFTYADRVFTLEALTYGAVLGSMTASIIIWFSCYNEIMTSDKFTYLFGGFIPSISLLFSMVLRFVPNLEKKGKDISSARECIGKAHFQGRFKDKMQNAQVIISIMTSWALEGAVVTSDSMRSRGYGCAKRRTNFAKYRFSSMDKSLLVVMMLCIVVVFYGMFLGVTKLEYYPKMIFYPIDLKFVLVAISYFILLIIPTFIHIVEELRWHILRSKI